MARDNMERAKVLLPKRIIAQATYDTRRNELDAAEDEGPHEDLTQLGVCLNESEQFFSSELDHFATCDGPNPYQRPATGQHRAFAGELPGAKSGDGGHNILEALS